MSAMEQSAINPDENRFAIAGKWLLRLQADDVEADEFSAWLAWYEADPQNRAAFEEAQAALEAARALSGEERVRWARELLEPRRPSNWARPIRFAWWRSLVAAPRYAVFATVALIGLAIGSVAWLEEPQPQSTAPTATVTIHTPIATHRTEALPDGSVVHLGARSSISLNFSNQTRFLVLESGEAFFTVAKDAARPFVVQAGQVRVRAIGTEFNVRRAAESTTVAVSEGVVEVAQTKSRARGAAATGYENGIRVSAGEQVVIRGAGTSEPPVMKPIQVAAVLAWQSGRIEFENEPLRFVVATVNRYSPREIVITDRSLHDLRVTGTVSGQHTEEWLRALPEIIPVKVIEISKETVLVSPAS